MRIIYLHQYFNTPFMGGGTRSYEMARRLVAKGHQVEMITTWREQNNKTDWFTTEEAGIRVHWLPVLYSNRMKYRDRIKAFLRFARASARKAVSLKGDVIFATSTPLTIAIPALYAGKRQKIPMVFETRDLWPDVPIAMGVLKNRIMITLSRWLEKAAYKNAAAIVALAPGMKESISKKNISKEKIYVIPNGCDFDIFSPAEVESHSIPNLKPENSQAKVIMYIGTMGLANGVEYIPKLAVELEKKEPDHPFIFYLIGDGRLRQRSEDFAAKAKVLNRKVFFIDTLPKHELAKYLQAADATIMTYAGPEIIFRDSVSNKFFDSLAAGKPVIANFTGFSSKTAQENGAGFILDNTPETAAGELLKLNRQPETFKEAGKAAYKLANQRFSRDKLADELEKVLIQASKNKTMSLNQK